MKGADFCYFHDESVREARLEAAARGGQVHRPLPAIDIEQLTAHLNDKLSVQAIVEGILRMQLAGAIPTRQVAQILRTLRIAERNVPESWMLKNGGGERYEAILQNFLETSGLIEESLDELDVHERNTAILDTGAKRAEYLKANQRHGPPPKHANNPAAHLSPSHPHSLANQTFRAGNFNPHG